MVILTHTAAAIGTRLRGLFTNRTQAAIVAAAGIAMIGCSGYAAAEAAPAAAASAP